ncbi:MAG: DUF2510 domain-containing protein [Acidimicrobiia bacterium]|nr:DUF2510 domain-containing protein [Acidimicrobiia bacterium]
MSTPDDVNSGDARRDEDPRPPGWYADPKRANRERWWNGENWTSNVLLGPGAKRFLKPRSVLAGIGGCLLFLAGGYMLLIVLGLIHLRIYGPFPNK